MPAPASARLRSSAQQIGRRAALARSGAEHPFAGSAPSPVCPVDGGRGISIDAGVSFSEALALAPKIGRLIPAEFGPFGVSHRQLLPHQRIIGSDGANRRPVSTHHEAIKTDLAHQIDECLELGIAASQCFGGLVRQHHSGDIENKVSGPGCFAGNCVTEGRQRVIVARARFGSVLA